MRVLGIETSCDETAASIVERTESGAAAIRSNIIYSQISEHEAYGGVVPEIAARAHMEKVDHLTAKAIKEAGIAYADLDGIAATAGPNAHRPMRAWRRLDPI